MTHEEQLADLRKKISDLDREVFALRDGLRSWKRLGEAAVAKVSDLQAELGKANAVIEAVHHEVEMFDSSICGTLAERVKQIADRVRGIIPSYCNACKGTVPDSRRHSHFKCNTLDANGTWRCECGLLANHEEPCTVAS